LAVVNASRTAPWYADYANYIVSNDKDELIPQIIITGYRMVIDFRKLNKATKKPFMSLGHGIFSIASTLALSTSIPDNLKYAYLNEKKIYPIIISANLSEQEEERLLKTLQKHRAAIGYTLDDLKGISPTLCQHKINLEDDAKPVRDPRRRLNPEMKDVVRKEILKLLEGRYNLSRC